MACPGNQEIGDYAYLSSIAPVNTAFGGTLRVGGAQNRVGNQDLGWEKMHSWMWA
jgi:hypothetical protein